MGDEQNGQARFAQFTQQVQYVNAGRSIQHTDHFIRDKEIDIEQIKPWQSEIAGAAHRSIDGDIYSECVPGLSPNAEQSLLNFPLPFFFGNIV